MKKVIEWLRGNMDKLLHALCCFAIVTAFSSVFPVWGGVIVAVVAGVTKEIYDEATYGGWSWGDIIADVVGIVAAIIVEVVR